MKVTRVDFIVVALCAIGSAVSARPSAATSYVPHEVFEEQQMLTTTDKRSEGLICLFHGANPAVVQQILGQEFSVFRNSAVETLSDKTPVGKVLLTDAVGAHYFTAVIIEGQPKAGDIVQLPDTYALVVLTNGRCETLKPTDREPGK